MSSRSGPARKYYRPTDAGYTALAESTEAWRALNAVATPVLDRPRLERPVWTIVDADAVHGQT